jgi:hypothetical protein
MTHGQALLTTAAKIIQTPVHVVSFALSHGHCFVCVCVSI